MLKQARVKTFRIGGPQKRGEGLRIGATRRPPRGIAKERWQKDGYFDVWFPTVAPSTELLRRFLGHLDVDSTWQHFAGAYERELERGDAYHAVQLLAALARTTPISLGCYCEDESRCHRSILQRVLLRAAAA